MIETEQKKELSQQTLQESNNNESEEGGMGFLDHLEELRWRLLKSLIGVGVVAVGCSYYSDFLVNEVLIGPLKRSSPNLILQNLVPYGQVSLYIQVVLFASVVLAFPILAYQIWQFVAPGLMPSERRAARFAVGFISLCFFSGIAFGYFVFLPISLTFFASFGSPLIQNNIAVGDYISFFLGTLLTSGVVFELPFVSYILSKMGFLTPAFMRFYRKHAIVVMMVIAAIVTPSTDAVTMLVIAVPMVLLYEVSIWISAYVNRKNTALK